MILRSFQKLSRPIFWLLLFAAGVGAAQIGVIDFLSQPKNLSYLWLLIRQHFILVGWSMLFAVIIGLSFGILASRRKFKRYATLIMYVLGLGQTIPALAILALSMLFLGVGALPSIVTLILISVLPIARNTYAGLTALPPYLVESARGIGMTRLRILCEIELPNALDVILTGLRIALVLNISTATLCYIIGGGGLGNLIFGGIEVVQFKLLVIGVAMVMSFALAADYGIERLKSRLLSPGLK